MFNLNTEMSYVILRAQDGSSDCLQWYLKGTQYIPMILEHKLGKRL